ARCLGSVGAQWGKPKCKAAPLAREGKRRALAVTSEDLRGALQRLPDAPCERDADEQPEQRGLPVEPALADAERAARSARSLRSGRNLELGDLLGAHVPLGIDRLDQVVADQAGDQHGA